MRNTANSHEALLARNIKRIAQYHNLPSYFNKSLTSISILINWESLCSGFYEG